MTRFLSTVSFLLICLASNSQTPGILNPRDSLGRYICPFEVIGNDTLPIFYLSDAYAWGSYYTRPEDIAQWDKLVRNVKKVWPYAELAGIKFKEYEALVINAKSDKERKELMKQAEKELELKFGKELRNLTFSQGKILIKLIDRQCGNSSYEVVKDFRGGFRAFFWQSLGRLFGYNLKVKYDPIGEDVNIERIVRLIEKGAL